MSQKIGIITNNVQVEAELNDSLAAKAIINALPIEASAQRWGGEIYFSISTKGSLEADTRDVLEPGELAYWPPGSALCIFFGPTPASQGNEIRAASDVNIVGKLKGDCSGLSDVNSGDSVVVEIV